MMSRILRLCMLCTLFLAGVFIGNAREKVKIFYIRLDHDIDNIARNRITKAIADAEKSESDYFILDLDTYGGAAKFQQLHS